MNMPGTPLAQDNEADWLAQRKQYLDDYIPAIRELARSQGEFIPDWRQISQRRQKFLQALPENADLLVFAYGSLMWNPLLRYSSCSPALLKGYHRSFCLHMEFFRGSRKNPGLMMALDTGGQCEGLCYRIPARLIQEETEILWMRECCLDGYTEQWVTVESPVFDTAMPAMTFVANHNTDRYRSQLSSEEVADKILNGQGEQGSTREYFNNTIEHLRELAIHDEQLEMLNRLLQNQGK